MDQRVASWTEIFSESWISRSSPEEAMRVLQQLVQLCTVTFGVPKLLQKARWREIVQCILLADSEKWLQVGFELLWFGWLGFLRLCGLAPEASIDLIEIAMILTVRRILSQFSPFEFTLIETFADQW
jgi:hypothetical protein